MRTTSRGWNPWKRLALSLALICAVPGAGCATRVTGANVALFETHRIALAGAREQTVFTAFVLGNPFAEVVTAGVDAGGHRRLRLYAHDGTSWALAAEHALAADVQFLDVARAGGQEFIIIWEQGRLGAIDAETGTVRELLGVPVEFNGDPARLPRVPVMRDLNGDGRDDVVIPGVDGFWIATQRGDGTFADPAQFGPPEPLREVEGFGEQLNLGEKGFTAETNEGYQSRVHLADANNDGRDDLLFWNEDHFDVHAQRADGDFDPRAYALTTEVRFDTDGLYSLPLSFEDASIASMFLGTGKRVSRKALHSLRDVSGDGVADLVTVTIEGRSALRQSGVVDIHFGAWRGGAITFALEPDTSIRPGGKPTALGYSMFSLHPSAGVDSLDALVMHVNTGVGQMVRAMAGNSIAMQVSVFRARDGAFTGAPDVRRRIAPPWDAFGKRGPFFPTVLLGDVTGDGRKDLVIGGDRDGFEIYPGEPGAGLFAEAPVVVPVEVPGDERRTQLVRLTRGPAQSILVHNAATHEVVLLLAR